jgi:hypothetical protein
MKALSMMQPYAWLVTKGHVTVDDRSWSTLHRGALAVHASKQFHQQYYAFLRKHTDIPLPEISEFEHGGLVGTVDVVDCIAPVFLKGQPNARPQLHRTHFGASGYYGLVLENPRQIPIVPYRGNRGLFDVPDRMLLAKQDG